MSAPRKDRLEAYLATTRTGSVREIPPSRIARWQRYVAITGSTMAMVGQSTISNLQAGPAEWRTHARLAPPHALFATPSAVTVSATPLQAPVISPNGVVPLYGTTNVIQPGAWVSIYGTNLASGTAIWKGDFPNSLAGTSVTINGQNAFLSFVSPTQINLQAPDDSTTGPVPVVVRTAAGTAVATVTLNPFSPTFELFDSMHVAAIILRSNGGGAYGGGAYDLLGPDGNCFGYPTVSAQAGDLVELFGIGFGPTNPTVPAGKPYSGAAAVTNNVDVYIDNIPIKPLWVGLSSAGMYQINVIIPPGLEAGDVPIQAWVAGYHTQPNLWLSLKGGVFRGACIPTGDGGDGGVGVGDGDGDGSGDGGVGMGDGGGDGDGGGVGDGGDGGGDGGDGGGSGDGGDGGVGGGDGGYGGDGGGDGGDGGGGGGGGDGGDGGDGG